MDTALFEICEITQLSEQNLQDIWELLVQADKDFVPTLTSRNSTTQSSLKTAQENREVVPVTYFDDLQNQCFICACIDNHIVGFMSYIKAYQLEDSTGDYVSTIIVKKSIRNQGITSALYSYLLEHTTASCVITRTWSQNQAHLHLLSKFGFYLVKRLPDDRGEGIDTVYYQKNL